MDSILCKECSVRFYTSATECNCPVCGQRYRKSRILEKGIVSFVWFKE